MNCEVLAIGSELLLGPSVDTNSAWIGQKLAENGISSYFHTAVGDNLERIVSALRLALERSDAVITTGGLGPTADDITREAIARVMDVSLELDPELEAQLRAIFVGRGREMSPSNIQQAMKPNGADVIAQVKGTAPGLICPIGKKVIYALPGVPHEMQEMLERGVLPDLRSRSGQTSVIMSRFLLTWGVAESVLGEMVAPRLEELAAIGNPTIAFLAHGIEGIHIRITARAENRTEAKRLLDEEEANLRKLIGPLVFGIDDATMESAVGDLLVEHGLTIGLAESMTGGLIAARMTSVPGASNWLRGGVVSYATEVKHNLLMVPDGPVISESAAIAMARGAQSQLGADVGLSVTGVAGPAEQEDQPVGTVFAAIAMPDRGLETIKLRLSGDRQRIRESTCINVLDRLRHVLQAL